MIEIEFCKCGGELIHLRVCTGVDIQEDVADGISLLVERNKAFTVAGDCGDLQRDVEVATNCRDPIACGLPE